MSTTTLMLTNDRAATDDIHLLLVAEAVSGLTGITKDVVTKLSDLTTAGEIAFETIKSGRLYVGLGVFSNPPTPDGQDYYGFVEFTKVGPDSEVWINLSNVDLVGLPLTLSGHQSSGDPFSLGYKTPLVGTASKPGLIAQIEDILVDNSPVVMTQTGQIKIVGPTGAPDSYPSFESYVTSLATQEATLEITSDAPKGGEAKVFAGSLKNAKAVDDVLISMVSQDAEQDTYDIRLGDFTSAIIYACDGGWIYYNGQKLPQNRTPAKDPDGVPAEQTITNSVFRDIVTVMNEGYFQPQGPNKSAYFSGIAPFRDGGNKYAQLIHEASNSYGFPYADGNLKTLITADPTQTITLTMLKDDQIADYQDYTSTPDGGEYQFGIGANSQSLGTIEIDIWSYEANSVGAYGGFLPDLEDWTKMEFPDLGPDHYIWIKNGDVVTGGCLGADPVWQDDGKTLIWGADVSWQAGSKSPQKPGSQTLLSAE